MKILVPKFFRKLMSLTRHKKKSGQISPNQAIVRWIYLLASLPNVSSIVEIGTWNGLGSSKCIVEGVLSRGSTLDKAIKVVGLEVNPEMYKSAKRNLAKYPFFEPELGSIVIAENLDSANLSEIEEVWFLQDKAFIEGAPYVIDKIPATIDLLILDGGEFSTYAEFSILSSRINKWLILDDTKTRKCKKIIEEIHRGKFPFEIVWESSERNGTAVLRRKNSNAL
jgi:hypothetical protein